MAPAPLKLAVGDRAPDFELPLARGGQIALSDLRGAPAVLWFFPGAHGPLCTRQACDLRDAHDVFTAAGYRVLGISSEALEELEVWSEEHALPYDLAADPSREVMRAYGAWGEKNMYGRIVEGTIRSSFAIDADGIITFARYRVPTPRHVALLREGLGI